MRNKNIIVASLVVILLGGLAIYQYTKQKKESAPENEKKMAQEKPVKNQEIATNEKANEPIDNSAENEIAIENSATIYFYGEECPHCKDVLAYLDENDIYSKVDFIKKEVWHDKNNGEELRKAALKCGMNPANIGVPFVFSEGKCYMGGPDVMNFFSQKAGIKK